MPRVFMWTAVLLSFALVATPVWLLVWCLASMFLRGVLIIGTLVILQWPVFQLMKRLGWLPPLENNDVTNVRDAP